MNLSEKIEKSEEVRKIIKKKVLTEIDKHKKDFCNKMDILKEDIEKEIVSLFLKDDSDCKSIIEEVIRKGIDFEDDLDNDDNENKILVKYSIGDDKSQRTKILSDKFQVNFETQKNIKFEKELKLDNYFILKCKFNEIDNDSDGEIEESIKLYPIKLNDSEVLFTDEIEILRSKVMKRLFKRSKFYNEILIKKDNIEITDSENSKIEWENIKFT